MRLPIKVTAYGNSDTETYGHITKPNSYKGFKWAVTCSPQTISHVAVKLLFNYSSL